MDRYRTYPIYGASLAPGERCGCQDRDGQEVYLKEGDGGR